MNAKSLIVIDDKDRYLIIGWDLAEGEDTTQIISKRKFIPEESLQAMQDAQNRLDRVEQLQNVNPPSCPSSFDLQTFLRKPLRRKLARRA